MRKAHSKSRNIGNPREDVQRHKRVLRQLLLAVDEDQRAKGSKDNQTDHLRRAPGKRLATKIKTEQEHQGKAQNGQTTEPVNCL